MYVYMYIYIYIYTHDHATPKISAEDRIAPNALILPDEQIRPSRARRLAGPPGVIIIMIMC